jgi:hypothetical protein
MDQESEKIRQQMEETRASLSDKLETLEEQVVGTVQQATCAVTETVENVKEAVQDTVETVKGSVSDTVETVRETFDLGRQVERHPCAMFFGSIAVGFVAGYFLDRSQRRPRGPLKGNGHGPTGPSPLAAILARDGGKPEGRRYLPSFREENVSPSAAPAEHSWLERISDQFAPEINKLKGLAIGSLVGLVRETVTSSMNQEIATHLREIIDSMTTKLGGHPVPGPILTKRSHSAARQEEPGEPLSRSSGSRHEALCP